MPGLDVPAGGERPELADAGRLARKLVRRAVRTARSEDQPLRQVLLDHLGPDAATLPTVSDASRSTSRLAWTPGWRPSPDAGMR